MSKPTGFFHMAVVMAATMGLGGCNEAPEVSVPVPVVVTADANVSDIDVTQHVNMALQQSESLRGFAIGVVTVKGDVRLIGAVDTQAQIDEAISIARNSDGAHTIHDALSIRR